MRRFVQTGMAAVMALLAGAGLPVALDDRAARRLSKTIVRKTGSGGKKKQEGPAQRGHRRAYIPSVRRKPCRFVFARNGKASADSRFHVIQNNDRIENALQARRLELKGLRAT